MGKYVKSSVVASYTLEGKLVNVYQSAKQASEALNVFSRSIDKAIRILLPTNYQGFTTEDDLVIMSENRYN